jgi:hypothetical protein
MTKIIPINQQNKSAMTLKVAADIYFQMFKKFNQVGIFHSYSEILFAALLEADHEVSCFTPQPMQVSIKGKRYIPDFHYIKNNQSFIVELKPRGEFNEEKRKTCEEVFFNKGMKFKVIKNEDVLNQEIKALNWLQIIRVILTSTLNETRNQELKILAEVVNGSTSTFGDVIDTGNRMGTMLEEIALYRLIYKGRLKAELSKNLISLNTEIKTCY